MSSDKTRLAQNIVAAMQANGDVASDATPAQISKLISTWTVVSGAILSEITGHMDIDLTSGDITVLPGTFQDSLHVPITGIGLINSSTLTGKLK